MQFTFQVSVEVTRQEGKFASRDELAEQIQQALDDANPNDLEGDSGGQYGIDGWDVEDVTEQVAIAAKAARKQVKARRANG